MKELKVLNVKINEIKKSQLLENISGTINDHRKIKLYTVNNEFIIEAQNNQQYLEVLNNSTTSVADSTGVVWAAKKIYNQKIERIAGADLFIDLLKIADHEKLNIFLLGGAEGVGLACAKRIEIQFPCIKTVEYLDGVTVDPRNDNRELIKRINSSKPNFLFVALGSPKQEIFIDKFADNINASLLIGIGGTLDYYSGKIRRAPEFMRDMGLEWLYRIILEPSRFKRIYKAVVVFPWLVLKSSRKQDT